MLTSLHHSLKRSFVLCTCLDQLLDLLSMVITKCSFDMILDITQKSGLIRKNQEFHIKEQNWTAETSLQEMILWEGQKDYATLNGKNNSKKLGKAAKDTWQYTYISTARSVVRMARLTDFCQFFFNQLLTSEKTLNQCCSEAYKHAFSAHHPYMIQGAAWAAIKMVPGRDFLLQQFKISSFQEVASLSTDFKTIQENLFKFLKDNKMDNLP